MVSVEIVRRQLAEVDGHRHHGRRIEVPRPDQHNVGLAAARRIGLRHAIGDYLIFLDVDGHSCHRPVRVGLETLMVRPNAPSSWVRETIDGDGSKLPTPDQPRVNRHHYQAIPRICFVSTPAAVTYLVRRTRLTGAEGPSSRWRWLRRRVIAHDLCVEKSVVMAMIRSGCSRSPPLPARPCSAAGHWQRCSGRGTVGTSGLRL